MVQPPLNMFRSWKSNFFCDDVLNAPSIYVEQELEEIRANGYNAIWVTGLLRDLSRSGVFPELNGPQNEANLNALKVLTERAARFGIRVIIYLVEPRGFPESDPFWDRHPELRGTRRLSTSPDAEMEAALCTSHPEVLDFLEDSVRELFRQVPLLGGLSLITASEFLHHCLCFSTPIWPELHEKQYENLCPTCRDRDAVPLVSEIVNRIAKGAYVAKPDALIIGKTWGWQWYEDPPQSRLIGMLDPRIAIQDNINLRGVREDADGSKRKVNEYALSYIGPSEQCRLHAELCQQQGRKFVVQLVLGTTHELTTVPCIPVPGRAYEKVLAAKALEPYGYVGFTFGSMPSVNTEVLKRLLDGDAADKDAFLVELAEDCFPGCGAGLVCKAWRYFSMAMSLYPFDNDLLYRGPVNYALAYKQYPGPVKGIPTQPTWLNFERDGDDLSSCCKAYGEEVTIERFEEMARLFQRGMVFYRRGLRRVPRAVREPELCNAGVIPLVFESTANIFSIHLLKKEWSDADIPEFRRLLEVERRTCVKALPLVRKDSRLGFHVEAQNHMFSEALIQEKIRHIDEVLESLSNGR